jgi:hypothetical protein
MKIDAGKLIVNGVVYVPESDAGDGVKAATLDGLPYVLVRTYSAGAHVGYLKCRNGREVTLLKSRRLWCWDGAASLSQIAMEGVKKPAGCKFAMEVNSIDLTEAIELIEVTEAARLNMAGVPVWKQ